MTARSFSGTIAGAALALAFLVAAGPALAGDKARDALSGYEKTGETAACIQLRSIRDTDFLDDYTMLVEVAGGGVYLNELKNRCAGVFREQRYIHNTSTNNMCSGDILRVVDSFGTVLGSCSLGVFEKLEKLPPKE